MPPEPYRDLYRPPSSRANSRPRALYTRPMSPEQEYVGWLDEPGNPADTLFGWSPTAWIAEKATAAVDVLADAGRSMVSSVVDFASDLTSTVNAAITGRAPESPGAIFSLAAGTAESIARLTPGVIKKAIGIPQEQESAGWIDLPDGRRISVPKGTDPVATAEKGLSDTLRAALQKSNLDAATARAKLAVETQKLDLEAEKIEISSDQWDRAFALKQRQAAQAEELGALQIRAVELAIERETASQPQRALWGRPSTIDTSKEKPQTVVRAVGMGLPGPSVKSGVASWALPW